MSVGRGAGGLALRRGTLGRTSSSLRDRQEAATPVPSTDSVQHAQSTRKIRPLERLVCGGEWPASLARRGCVSEEPLP